MNRDDLLVRSLTTKYGYNKTQALLKKHGFPILYSRERRDSIIIWAIYHSKSVEEVDRLCKKYNCKQLSLDD